MKKIEEEISIQKQFKTYSGQINNLVDKQMSNKLYQAAENDVKVRS
jgi:polyphosphate kinase